MDAFTTLEAPIRFGPFRLIREEFSLARATAEGGWQDIALRPKAFDLLRYMLENPGRLIAAEEFLDRLWPQVHVQAEGLKGHMLQVRTALGDDPSAPIYIETVRGRGYRFIAPLLSLEQLPLDRRGGRHEVRPLLVGREGARRELDTLLRQSQGGEATIGFVTGDPGIGKTSITADFMEQVSASGATIAISRCLPGNADSDAYYPLLEILTQLARDASLENFAELLSTVAPTWLIQLPWLIPETLAGGTRQDVLGTTPHRMIRELCDLLDLLSRDRLLLIVIEDIHWADQSTLDLLNAVAARRLQSRLLFLATMRVSGDHPSARMARTLCQTLALYRLGKEILLKPLTGADIAEYLAESSSFDPPVRLTALLLERSEGNPLFMTAILENFFQRGVLAIGRTGWELDDGLDAVAGHAPPNLARMIEAEIEKLDASAQAVLAAASVSEGEFSSAEYHTAASLDEETFELVCETLAKTTILIRRSSIASLPSGRRVQRYLFRHMIYREVVYDRQTASKRATSHLAVGEALEAMHGDDAASIAPLLARNFLAAEHWGKAVHFMRLVARNAMARFSSREAAATLEQALGLTMNLPPDQRSEAEVALLEDLAHVYAGSLDPRAFETFERLVRTAESAERLDVQCRALLGLGFALAWNDLDRSRAVLSEAITKSEAIDDPVARARIRTFGHGWRSWSVGWSEVDARACEKALAEIKASGDVVALNASYVDYTLITFPSSRYAETHDLITNSFDVLVRNPLDSHSEISLPLWILRLGRPLSLMYLGRLGAALTLFRSGVAAFRDNGDVGRAATLQFYEAFCHLVLRDHRTALELCDQALAFRDSESAPQLSPNERQIEMVVRGLAELSAGKTDRAIGLLTAARDVMARVKTLTTWHWRMALEWGMTDAYLAAGLVDEARRHADILHRQAFGMRERTWRAFACESGARVALRDGDLLKVTDCLAAAWRETEAGSLPLVEWRLHAIETRRLERLGQPGLAREHERDWQANLERLAETLPTDHPGRRLLIQAHPNF